MKSKTGGSRARLSKLPSPSPATRSLPFLSLDPGEVYGECSVDRTVDRMSREKNESGRCGDDAGASRCCENNEIDMWADDYDDLDLSGDFMDSDLEIKTCIICLKGGGGDVLLCSEIGCPIAVHKKCAHEFDGLDKFYCPYCVFKRAELRKEKLKMKARDLKKHLSDFLDFKPSGGDNVRMNEGRVEGKESNTLAPSGERDCGDCGDCGDRVVTNQVENRFVLVESGQQNDEDNIKLGDLFAKSRTVIEHQRDSLAPISCLGNRRSQSQEKLPGVESLVDSVSKEQSSEQNVTMNEEPEILEDREQVDEGGHKSIEEDTVEEENVVDGPHHLSEKGVSNAVKPKRRREEEQSLPEVSGADTFDSDTEPISVRQRRRSSEGTKKVQAQRGANPQKITRSRNVEVIAPEKSRKQQASATKSSNLPFANEKRKRKDWKTEEEKMLREAVHKFSSTVKKNLPWRKMLEFGRHVFDPTRNPADLKDKWRNMKAKESSSTSRK